MGNSERDEFDALERLRQFSELHMPVNACVSIPTAGRTDHAAVTEPEQSEIPRRHLRESITREASIKTMGTVLMTGEWFRSGMFSLNSVPPTLMSDGTRAARFAPTPGRNMPSLFVSRKGPPGTLGTPARTSGSTARKASRTHLPKIPPYNKCV